MNDEQNEMQKIARSKSIILKVNIEDSTKEFTIREECSLPANPDLIAAEAEVIRLMGQARANNWTKLFDTLCGLLKEWGPYAGACGVVYFVKKSSKN